MYNLLNFIDYINIMLIHIQPLQGWHVGGIFPTGCTCGYSYSTPSGLARRGHISHRLHLWLFIFNPFRVGTSGAYFPQVAPVAIHIQPLRGWRVGGTFPTGCTCGYSPFRVGTSGAAAANDGHESG